VVGIPHRTKERSRLIMIGFFDETGDFASDRVSYFAGLISTAERWTPFYEEWDALLRKRGIVSFHAKQQRKDPVLFRELAEVAMRHAVYGFCIGINAKDYKEASPAGSKEVKADMFVFLRVLKYVQESSAWANDDRHLECVFDERPDSSRFYKAWKNLKGRRMASEQLFAAITFADDRFVTPLQAADLLCMCCTRPELKSTFDFEAHPIFGKRVLREMWDAQKFEKYPESVS